MPMTMNREDWNRRYATKAFIWTIEANRFLAEEAAELPPGRALELAAGEGRNAVWLAEQGWAVRAVDFSDVAVEKGRRLAATRNVAGRIDWQVADLRSHAPETGRFDLVAVLYLQIAFGALAPILVRAARAVAPGGTFLLVGHHPLNLERGHGGPWDPGVLYTAQQVAAALDGELAIERADLVERPVETAAGTRIAFDCLVRGRRP
jgi:SAM-dependent methyltransferase